MFEAAGEGAGGAAVRAVVPVSVDGASLGGDGVVAGNEPGQDGGAEPVLAGGAGSGGRIACPQQQAGHLGGPFLQLRFGVVDVLQVAEQVRAAQYPGWARAAGVSASPTASTSRVIS